MANTYKLDKGETLLWVKHPSMLLLVMDMTLLAIGIIGIYFIMHFANVTNTIISLAILGVGVFVLLMIAANWLSKKYILTDKKVATQIGIFGNKYKEISFADIQSVSLAQNFWGMIFNYGTLTIEAAGANNFVRFDSIGGVKEIEQQISELSGN